MREMSLVNEHEKEWSVKWTFRVWEAIGELPRNFLGRESVCRIFFFFFFFLSKIHSTYGQLWVNYVRI